MTDMHLYYLKNKEKILSQQKKYRSTPKGAYFNLLGRCQRHNFKICGLKEFMAWYMNAERICYYCGIPEDKLKYLPISKLFKKRFTIDKKDPTKGYFPSNMALSCNLCNMIKSNYFTPDEMKALAKDYVTPKWQKMRH